MKGKPTAEKFKGYSKDRFEVFRKTKEEIYYMKNGRFSNKSGSSSLVNSKESTMIEPGALFAMDNLFEDCQEKLFSLSSIRKKNPNTSVDEVKILHSKLRLQTINQNKQDLSSYKDKVNFSLIKISEIEKDIAEIKRIEPEEGKRYEDLSKRHILPK